VSGFPHRVLVLFEGRHRIVNRPTIVALVVIGLAEVLVRQRLQHDLPASRGEREGALGSGDRLAFWAWYGRRTVERLRLRRGARVPDVCCGTGASTLPAAQAVGPEGQVIAVDLAGELLKLGQAKAAGLHCVECRHGDMTDLGFPDGHFDAAVCVFGIFFVPDMKTRVAELWRMVRPGGRFCQLSRHFHFRWHSM
jgi:SAM-dependent methyltransferase